MKSKGFSFSLLLCLSITAFSQEYGIFVGDEGLYNLRTNPALNSEQQVEKKTANNLVYIIDTLKLPFVDDFSKNKIKKYNAQITDANVFDSTRVRFTVNGAAKDSIVYSIDTTRHYIYNTTTQQMDTFLNQRIVVVNYNYFPPVSNPWLLFEISSIDSLWPAYEYIIDNNGDSTYIDTIPYIVKYNTTDTFYFVKDESYSIWVDSNVYINRSYGINPPTIGIATFDGLDASGNPYDFTNANTYGIADYLSSKPINISSFTATDSVIMSFFYQPQGNGEAPEKQDSLSLEFFAPLQNDWKWAWSASGSLTQAFSQIKIHIKDTAYLKNGFKFRFKNYATLSGNLDHWNIDYVYIDTLRSLNKEELKDLAYVKTGFSFINTYTSMPWKTYKTDVQKFTAKEYEFTLKNFFNKSISNNLNQYHVYDKSDNSLVFSSNQFLNNQPNFPADSSITMNHTINKPLPDNDFRFPVNDTLTRKTFDIQLTSLTNETQINYDNDTIAFSQIFDTYYAYDDGSAEKGYALVGAGAKIACQFTIDKKDTLRAVHFYFPPMMENVTLNTFSIHIWSNLNPETILYKTVLKNPQYSERNEFVRYDIDTILPLSGTFYVGWKQTTADKIYLGFDENIDTQSKIFYKTGTSWNNTVFDGSLMLRPDFGTPPPPPAGVSDNQNNYKNFNIFPNPASTHINLKNNISYEERYFYSLYDIFGREVLKSNNIGREISINVAQLPEGIYFIAISNSQNTLIETKKVLIKR